MIKKIISGICAVALSITAFASLTVSADYTDFYLASGKTAAADGVQYFTVNKTGGADSVTAGTIYVKATAGYFIPGNAAIGVSEKIGLNNGSAIAALKKYQDYTCMVVADGAAKDPDPNDGYDVIAISWANSANMKTEGDVVFEALLVNSGEVSGDCELILYGHTFKNNGVEEYITVNKAYTLASGTSTLTAKTDEKPVTIEETEVANDSNGRFAKGFGAKFTDVTAGGTVNVKWTLTNTETEATDSKTIAYDTTGISGNVAVGLVINMADTNVFENITAAAEIVE